MLTGYRRTITMLGLSFLATMQTGIAWASVGQFHFTSGEVKVVDRGGKARAASKGGGIDVGETIITGPAASAQLKMIDGGIIAVRPDTQLRVDTYVFKGKEDGTEKGQVSLLRGGFRTITGAIGHINKDNYKVTTPSATIGIRGTDHEPIFIPPALPGQPPIANAGTYDKVNVGAAYIATPQGSVNIQPNQVGYAAPGAMPQILPVVPNIYKQAPTPIQAKEEKEKEEGKKNGEQQATAAAKPAEEKKDTAAAPEQKTAETAPAPVRTTAAVDSPATTIAPSMVAVTVAPVAIVNAPVLMVEMTDQASGTTVNLTDSTLTSETGETVELEEVVAVIQAAATAGETLSLTEAVAVVQPPSIAVVPPPSIPVQAYAQADVSFETSVNSNYYEMYYYGWGWMSGMAPAANVAPLANPPSFTMSENDWYWGGGIYGVQFPGATGAVNGNAASFATTGIQFGRWTTVPTIVNFSNDIPFAPGSDNYFYGNSTWAFAPEGYLDNPTILSSAAGGTVTGVFNYALNGAPAPKDQYGVAGTLNSLSLAADFTTQTVTAALSASLGTTTWTASSAAPMNIGAWNGSTAGFGGNLTVSSSEAGISSNGYVNGAFTGQNYAGAIVGYNLYDYLVADGMMTTSLSGVAALTRNGVAGNATVANGAAAPTGKFVVAEAGPYNSGYIQTVDTVTTSAGVLTGYTTTWDAISTSATSLVCTTCTGQAAPDAATGIHFGTWDEGTRSYSYTSAFGGQFHWIKGPGPDPFYLPEALTGTMTYALDGGTAPTNQNGLAGTLTSAHLGVNFTQQTVDISLGLSGVNGHNWTANSVGTPLEWVDYSKNGFWAYSALGMEVLPPGYLTVTMDGGTPGQGYISGQLTGNGLNGALFQYQLSAPLAMPGVPTTFIATDTITAQASSMTVDWPLGGSLALSFPADSTGTLTPIAATTLNVTLDSGGVPVSAAVSGGVNATVAALTPVAAGSYAGLAATGEFVFVETSGHLVANTGVGGGLQYSNFGQWGVREDVVENSSAIGPFTLGSFAGGMLLTPPSSMPVNNYPFNGYNSSYYAGSMIGSAQNSLDNNTLYRLDGGVSLNANFSTGALTGTMNYIYVTDVTTGSSAGYFNDLTLATTIAGNGFSGTVTAGANPVSAWPSPINVPVGTTGTTSGHFYGPNANELTGVWGVNSGTIMVAGAFGAANGTSALQPYESVNGTVALAAAAPADVATPYRLVALSGYDPASVNYYNNGMVTDGGFNNIARVTTDVAGHVTQFDSGFGYDSVNDSVTLALGTATPTNSGIDPVSGITWGRWQGGTFAVTDRTTGTVNSKSLGASSLHWIAGPGMTGPVALPTTGTYNYVLAGGTTPTDNLGNLGVLNSATLQADFAAQTVNVGVNVGINNATLNASGANISIQQRTMFDAHTNNLPGSANLLTATCVGTGCAGASPQASIGGAFTGATGGGAGMTYGFVNGTNVVSGVAAFHR